MVTPPQEYAYQPHVHIVFKYCEHIVIMPVTITMAILKQMSIDVHLWLTCVCFVLASICHHGHCMYASVLFTWFTEWLVYVLHLGYRFNRLCMTEMLHCSFHAAWRICRWCSILSGNKTATRNALTMEGGLHYIGLFCKYTFLDYTTPLIFCSYCQQWCGGRGLCL